MEADFDIDKGDLLFTRKKKKKLFNRILLITVTGKVRRPNHIIVSAS